jgi:hypothetical protein
MTDDALRQLAREILGNGALVTDVDRVVGILNGWMARQPAPEPPRTMRGEWPGGSEPFPNEAERAFIEASREPTVTPASAMISKLELWHLLFPEGSHADYESGDIAAWLDEYTKEIERYTERKLASREPTVTPARCASPCCSSLAMEGSRYCGWHAAKELQSQAPPTVTVGAPALPDILISMKTVLAFCEANNTRIAASVLRTWIEYLEALRTRERLLENADLLEVLQKYLPPHILKELGLQTISQLCGGINDLIALRTPADLDRQNQAAETLRQAAYKWQEKWREASRQNQAVRDLPEMWLRSRSSVFSHDWNDVHTKCAQELETALQVAGAQEEAEK